MIKNDQIRIFTKDNEGGCKEIYNWVHAWIYKKNKCKTLALYDKDAAGQIAYKELVDSQIYKQSQNNKADFLPPTEAIIGFYKKNIELQYEIEHLLSTQCWKRIKVAGYASERTSNTLNDMLRAHANKNKSAVDVFNNLIPDSDIRDTILYFEPEKNSKMKIFNMVDGASKDEKNEYMIGFKKLIDSLERRFCSKQSELKT